MRYHHLFIFITVLLETFKLSGQCPQPVVESVVSYHAQNIDLSFHSQVQGSYELKVFAGYYESGGSPAADTLQYTGEVSIGLNQVNFQAGSILNLWSNIFGMPELFYYSAELSIDCGNELSEAVPFYFSPHSLLNSNELNFSFYSEPCMLIPDADQGSVLEYQFEISPDISLDPIEDIFVFLDIFHHYNGDLHIELVSPTGTSISLLNPNSQDIPGNHLGLSTIFTDYASKNLSHVDFVSNPWGSIHRGPRGIFLPEESFSAFSGELPQGIWTLKITDTENIHQGILYGFGLNFNNAPWQALLEGKVYYDLNANNIYDDEATYNNGFIELDQEQSRILTNPKGEFYKFLQPGTDSLSVADIQDNYVTEPFVLSSINSEVITNIEIPITPLSAVNDLQIDLLKGTSFVPGNPNGYICSVKNTGTQCINDVQVLISIDESIELENLNQPGVWDFTSQNGNSAQWSIDSICPTQEVVLFIECEIPAELSSTNTITSSASILNTFDDANIENNEIIISHQLDSINVPNKLSVNRDSINSDFLFNNGKLEYILRFQNTSSNHINKDLIFECYLDTLYFDIQSLKVLGSSGQILLERLDDLYAIRTTQALNASFFNLSYGYIKFSIKPRQDILPESIISLNTDINFGRFYQTSSNTVSTTFWDNGMSDILLQLNPDNNFCDNPYDLNLYDVSTNELAFSFTGSISQEGLISVPYSVEGDYLTLVQIQPFLNANLGSFNFEQGQNLTSESMFVAGDINGDNSIDIQDFSVFAANYGSSYGELGFTSFADFNCDNTVNIVDYALFSINYGENGAEAP